MLFAFTVIGVQYWTLAVISKWLMCDDSSAVETFTHTHHVIGALAAFIWGADDYIWGRYLVVLILAIVFAFSIRKTKLPDPF